MLLGGLLQVGLLDSARRKLSLKNPIANRRQSAGQTSKYFQPLTVEIPFAKTLLPAAPVLYFQPLTVEVLTLNIAQLAQGFMVPLFFQDPCIICI